mmetsp:Transcript_18268/g.22364  ORF Transcript_18268/g.22364 Transcript_18268/m.22364 type:complete len:117 (-) Transcript_18268:2707-3057(-)
MSDNDGGDNIIMNNIIMNSLNHFGVSILMIVGSLVAFGVIYLAVVCIVRWQRMRSFDSLAVATRNMDDAFELTDVHEDFDDDEEGVEEQQQMKDKSGYYAPPGRNIQGSPSEKMIV